MTDEAIQEGFRAIRSGSDYDGLYRSAQCRSQADWLVGMNASRAFTLRYDALLSVGRVQTPTLAILVKRRKEIEDFKPEEYATVTADFGDYRGMYFREGLEPDTHIPKIDDAKALAAQIKNQSATVISAETTRRRDLPARLHRRQDAQARPVPLRNAQSPHLPAHGQPLSAAGHDSARCADDEGAAGKLSGACAGRAAGWEAARQQAHD